MAFSHRERGHVTWMKFIRRSSHRRVESHRRPSFWWIASCFVLSFPQPPPSLLLLVPLRFEPLSIGKVTFIWISLSRLRATPQRRWSERISRAGQGWRHENGIPFTFIFRRPSPARWKPRFSLAHGLSGRLPAAGLPPLATAAEITTCCFYLEERFDWWRTLMRLAEDFRAREFSDRNSLPPRRYLSSLAKFSRITVRRFTNLRADRDTNDWSNFTVLYPIRSIKPICVLATLRRFSVSS